MSSFFKTSSSLKRLSKGKFLPNNWLSTSVYNSDEKKLIMDAVSNGTLKNVFKGDKKALLASFWEEKRKLYANNSLLRTNERFIKYKKWESENPDVFIKNNPNEVSPPFFEGMEGLKPYVRKPS
ncbi:MAG: hypothetical protein WCJ84_02445 [Candidatus Peregrinibacteria bacterium]